MVIIIIMYMFGFFSQSYRDASDNQTKEATAASVPS